MKIIAVEAVPVSRVVRPDLAIVSAAGKHPESHYVLVSIHSDEGQVGYGEATVVPVWSGESQAGCQRIICELLSPLLIGQNPLHVGMLADAVDRTLIGNPFTKAAVEMALLDLSGKILGIPVHLFLGGPRRPPQISVKFSIGAFAPAEAVRVAKHAVANGIRAVKVKVGLDLAQDVARVEAVRVALGEGFRIAVDANGGCTENEAVRSIYHWERLGVNAIEQPLRRGEFRGCARLRKRTAIPIMLDESIFTPQDAMEAVRHHACDIISIYPGKNGGILRSLEIAQIAASAGLQCTIGSNLEMDLGTAAMLQLALAVPALSATVDHDIIGPLYYDDHIGENPIRFVNGCALVPEGTGLGLKPCAPKGAEQSVG
jgi:L-alanine-DL-glutamate epimerase-like enolase superfamily enzyme